MGPGVVVGAGVGTVRALRLCPLTTSPPEVMLKVKVRV